MRMKYLKIVKDVAFLMVTILCFSRISLAAVRRTTASEVRVNSESDNENDFLRTVHPEKELEVDEKGSKITEKEVIEAPNQLLNPFASFPFFPFHFPNLKRETSHLNSTKHTIHVEKDRSARKPFFFIDFEFNIEKIPLKNQTNEMKDNDMNHLRKDMPYEMLEDWSFFDDAPPTPPEMDEFLPRSDLLFFDFPFRRRHNKNLGQGELSNPRSVSSIADILDRAMKKEMVPILDLANGKDSESLVEGENTGNTVKSRSYDIAHRKTPLVLGKMVKIGEIHFGEDYPKGRKRRRNTSKLRKKANHGIQETSIELIRIDEPKLTPLKDVFRKVRDRNGLSIKSDSQIIKLNNWDNKELDEKADSNTQLHSGAVKTRSSGDDDFAYFGQGSYHKEPGRASVGFEILKPHSSFSRLRERIGQENATVVKDEISRNITHVLGEFFSMIKKLHNSKSFYGEKENSETDEEHCPVLSEINGSGMYSKDSSSGHRIPRDATDDGNSHRVADLVYLFLTVTLPTMLAFTLLLVVCYVNLRMKGWLCAKLFNPRNVYVVERDAEKAGRETSNDPNKQDKAARLANAKKKEKHRPNVDSKDIKDREAKEIEIELRHHEELRREYYDK
ncbi:UNVERIFIED_CONTAM: hypothetical protein PYX00_002503 [Menopon gallinae]|uniref:Uncharacterized protein n=1 Tax=Menopon gallinae TaxID=328185 RepID=A0AAW2IHA5_9NEOP